MHSLSTETLNPATAWQSIIANKINEIGPGLSKVIHHLQPGISVAVNNLDSAISHIHLGNNRPKPMPGRDGAGLLLMIALKPLAPSHSAANPPLFHQNISLSGAGQRR